MARKYTGPKREDGTKLTDIVISEHSSSIIQHYLFHADEDGAAQIYTFYSNDEAGKEHCYLSARLMAGLREYFRKLDADAIVAETTEDTGKPGAK